MMNFQFSEEEKNSIPQDLANRIEKAMSENSLATARLTEELEQLSTSNYAGGIPNNQYNRGDQSEAFGFPFQFAQTCKRMLGSPYLSPVLQFYKSLFLSLQLEIEVTGKDEQSVQFVNQFIQDQFDAMGGLSKNMVDIAMNTLTYGFSFFSPKLANIQGYKYGTKRHLEGLRGFKHFDPITLYNFTFDDKDSDEIISIGILAQPKRVGEISKERYMSDEDYIKKYVTNEKSTEMNLKQLLVKSNCMGYISHGNMTGNPLGVPFLYDVYSLWRVAELMDESFAKNLKTFGEHSFNAVPIMAEVGENELAQIVKDVTKFIRNKGGVFASRYAKLEKIEGIDGRKWADIKEAISALIFKAKGVDVKALGLTSGATRNLAEITQGEGYLNAKSIMESFIQQFNNTFFENYIALNFKDYIMAGKIDMPKIKIKEIINEEAIAQGTQKQEIEPSQEQQTLSAIRNDRDVLEVNTETPKINQQIEFDFNGNTTSNKTFIKSKPDSRSAYVVDTTELDNTMLSASDSLTAPLTAFMKNKLTDIKTIQTALRTPQNINRAVALNANEKKEVSKIVAENMAGYATAYFVLKATEIEKGLALQNKTFDDVFKMNKFTWANKEAEKYQRANATLQANSVIGQLEKVMLDTLSLETQNFNKKTDSLDLRTISAVNAINAIKGVEVEKVADNVVYNQMNDTSNIANEIMVKKDSGYGIVRSGVLDRSQCEHCKSLVGALYLKNGDVWYNEEGLEYENVPDSKCSGGAGRCRCFYASVPVRTLQAIERNLEAVSQ